MRWLDSIMDSMDMNLSKLQETVKDRGAWHAAVRGFTKNQDMAQQLNNNNSHGNSVKRSVYLLAKFLAYHKCSRNNSFGFFLFLCFGSNQFQVQKYHPESLLNAKISKQKIKHKGKPVRIISDKFISFWTPSKQYIFVNAIFFPLSGALNFGIWKSVATEMLLQN